MTPTLRRPVLLALLLGLAGTGPLRAQPTFTQIVVQDQVPLDLPPRAADVAADGDVFITRASLSPAARVRLCRGLGFDEWLASEPQAPGPVILSGNPLVRIPGDRHRGRLWPITSAVAKRLAR